jgi:hypothetical protein
VGAEARLARIHATYSRTTFASSVEDRAANIIAGTWSYHGLPALAILLAAFALPIWVTRLVIGTVLGMFAAYLAYAHDPTWTLYYLELQAPLAFLTSVGLWRLADHIASLARGEMTRMRVRTLAFAGIVVLLAAPAIPRTMSYRRAHADQRRYREALELAVASLPPDPAIVFIPYDTTHGEARLMQNEPNLATARVWLAHDCAADDGRLLALAPGRRAYSYRIDAATGVGRLQPFLPEGHGTDRGC